MEIDAMICGSEMQKSVAKSPNYVKQRHEFIGKYDIDIDINKKATSISNLLLRRINAIFLSPISNFHRAIINNTREPKMRTILNNPFCTAVVNFISNSILFCYSRYKQFR